MIHSIDSFRLATIRVLVIVGGEADDDLCEEKYLSNL